MGKRSYSFVRAHRRRWGLTQAELAMLLGAGSSTTMSRIERSMRRPTATVIIACSILFGLPVPELFSTLHDEVAEVVGTAAKSLYDELEGKTDKQSVLKRQLIEDVLARIINRSRSGT